MSRTFGQDVTLLVLGAVLTSCVGTGLSWFITHRQQLAQEKVDKAARFAAAGAAIESDILGRTSMIWAKLGRTRLLVGQSDTDEERAAAKAYADSELTSASEDWNRNILLLRNQVGRVFGDAAARRIYVRESAKLFVDPCGVVATHTDEAAGTDCPHRLANEVQALDRLNQELNAGSDLASTSVKALVPSDFQGTLRLARVLVQRQLTCITTKDRTRFKPRCDDLARLAEVTSRRVDLVGVMQEKLADEFRAAIPAS